VTDTFWLQQLRQQRAIAVIRVPQFELGLQMARVAAAEGMQLIEITWNCDRPAALIAQLRSELPQCWIGAGTLLAMEPLQRAIAAGAQFLFSPHGDRALLQAARECEIPLVPGALSPSEIVGAWQAGASAVKVFPVQAMGNEGYIQSLQGPLGQIPLIPTGGVTLDNAIAFLQAGAIAVGLSSQLFPKQAIQARDWSAIAQRVQILKRRLARYQDMG